jgi:hypothetical protein
MAHCVSGKFNVSNINPSVHALILSGYLLQLKVMIQGHPNMRKQLETLIPQPLLVTGCVDR